MTVERLAKDINKHCENYEAFWAFTLIKETLNLWRVDKYYQMLSEYARVYADHYLEAVE